MIQTRICFSCLLVCPEVPSPPILDGHMFQRRDGPFSPLMPKEIPRTRSLLPYLAVHFHLWLLCLQEHLCPPSVLGAPWLLGLPVDLQLQEILGSQKSCVSCVARCSPFLPLLCTWTDQYTQLLVYRNYPDLRHTPSLGLH